MKILAIETSCDDTCASVFDKKRMLSNIFWSKIKTHEKWGGVVPLEAKRQHEEFLEPVINDSLEESGIPLNQIECIAITYGPGLAIALEPGIAKAKELSKSLKIPLIAVNHMVGHIYSSLAKDSNGDSYANEKIEDFEFPALALTISGGHTDMYLMKKHMDFEHVAWTLDDALGEAFDKVGRLLGLGFPAGHKVEVLAQSGDKDSYRFPRPLLESAELKWSFSGLKTSVLYEVMKLTGDYPIKKGGSTPKFKDLKQNLDEHVVANLAAAFQAAALESLCSKVELALKLYNPKMLIVGGGVIANHILRKMLTTLCSQYGMRLIYPTPIWLCTDNAGMIAVATHYMIKTFGSKAYIKDLSKLDRVPNLEI